METKERVEREINLIDLFWKILFSWRQMLCFGILFAVLLSGGKYFLDARTYQASMNVDLEESKKEFNKEELEKYNNAIDLQKRITGYETYQQKSALMQIDPFEKPVLEQQYYVQSDYIVNYTKDSERDYTLELVSIYNNYINSGEMAQKVIEDANLSINEEDFRELLSVTLSESVISISVSYVDVEKLNDISDVIKSFLQQKESEVQNVGAHTLKLIEESQSMVVDSALVEKKNTIASNITALKTQLKSLKTGMSASQLALFELEASKINGAELEEDLPSVSVKFLIVGVMAGFFLVGAWIVLMMIFSTKLQKSEEIQNIYGIHMLGEIKIPDQKKRFLASIDRLLLSLKNKGKKKIGQEQQIKVIATKIALSCKQRGVSSIYMTGSEYEKADKTIMEQLKREFRAQDIEVNDGGNMAYDASSLKSGIENGTLLLVEQIGISAYREIEDELKLIKEHHGALLGVIVLE